MGYYIDYDGKLKKKKDEKKQTVTTKGNTGGYYVDYDGKVKQREQEIDQELAPSKKDGGKLDFFKKSTYFDNGYQFGDISKTFSASMADFGISALSGLGQNVEGVTDLAGHLLAVGADKVGADRLASGLHKMANHNTVQSAADWLRDPEGDKGIGVGEGSIFGRTSQGVGQALGQIGGLILTGGAGSAAGLGAKGVTALTTGTRFATSAGAGMSEAYNAGAGDAEALVYGGIKGGVDAATGLIFGGLGKGVKALGISHGLTSIDDVVAKKISSQISSRFAKTLVQAGVKASGEGFEEVLAGLGTAAAKKLTYMSDTELKQLVEDENLLEQFVVGAIASGIMQGGDFRRSVKTDTDFISGLNKSEEAVVQKEYEKRLAEEEKNGKALTKKEQNALYDEVLEDMDRGDISIDTIEEVLGGEDYTKYQDTKGSEDVAKQEYERLANIPENQLTRSQKNMLDQYEAQMKEEPKSAALKKQLEENVYNLSQGNRFMSSYTEKANRSVAFEADVSKYDEKQQQVVQKAIDSGILNNTRKTHDFVDMLAKLSAEKGVSFDFANNAKLKESGFALNGKSVNGYVTKDGITLNIDSKKALNTVVGHEITHILEGTELYDSLQTAVFEYAQTKGEYDSRLEAITELYKDVKDADINGELTADLVGDYLFADSEFVRKLSTENRSLFRTIWDEVKYLASIATAGSKEARQLKRVEKAFADAFRGEGKAVEGVKYSLNDKKTPTYKEITEKKPLHIVDVKTGIETATYAEMKTAAKKIAEENGWFDYPHLNEDTDSLIFITKDSFTHAFSNLKGTFGEDTIRSMAHIPEIIKEAVLVDVRDPKDKTKAEKKVYTFFAAIDGVNGVAPVKLTVKEFDFKNLDSVKKNIRSYFEKNGIMENYNSLYDATALEVIGIESIKKETDASGKVSGNNPMAQTTSVSEISVTDLLNLVKGDAAKYIPGDEKRQVSHSLSPENEMQQQGGRGNVYGRDVALEDLPIREMPNTESNTKSNTENRVGDMFRDDNLPMRDDTDERLWSLTDEDAPAEVEPNTDSLPSAVSDPLADKTWAEVGNRKVKAYMYENPEVKPYFQQEAQYLLQELRDTVKGERIYYETEDGSYGWTGTNRLTSDTIATLRDEAKLSYKDIEKGLNAIIEDNGAENIAAAKRIELVLSDRLINGYTDFLTGDKIPPNQGYINTLDHMQRLEASEGNFDSLMEIADDIAPKTDSRQDLKAEIPVKNPPAESPAEKKPILTVKERLEAKLNNLETELADIERQRQESWKSFDEEIGETVKQWESKKNKNTQTANDLLKRIARRENNKNTVDDSLNKRANDIRAKIEQVQEEIKAGESPKEQAAMRREVHEKIISDINEAYRGQGFEFDDVLKNAKDLSTFATVDNTPQRVMEKALGYKQGKILADMTVNKVAQNETEGIKWLNRFTDRKNGLLAQISKQYNIKPGSKESAAAQMYAEGFYVNDKNEIVEYKDKELALDFPDARVRENIKGLAKDKRIREIYDATLDAINASRRRNAYPEIKKLDNYFLHFRAQTDTFSRLGIPFNPNDITAKDLPTDLNGVTADLKPGQPYFASSMHRKGKRTSFDLLGGLEQYLTSAKDQIYHIDDIQTLRALRNYIADNYGQAKGLDNLDALTEEEQEAKIKEVFDAHLSTFAKFLNEEANVIAGKTSLTDRGLEGVIGRKGITLLDTINRQVGANMVGFNVSSSLTNFLSVTQAFAKSNKADFVKAMAQTVSNKLGKGDGFAESSPVMIRRKGADRFARKPWQKAADAGYVLMQAVDNISTEIIARAKYNELTRKGLTSEQAHIETDKWVSRLMGDRSLGQQPQLYNSKMLGLFTKFQLEVRNQLDSQFYDTVQEAKESTEDIKNATERNAKVAAKVASKLFQLAVVQHLFGKAFESVAGYNPAFDIIGVLIKTLGLDDEEEDDDTALDNIEQGFLELMGDLPYTSTLTGGRVPISSALPITQFFTGKDQYGNEKSRVETVAEALPYFVLPGGYGQIKKTTQGLSMFDDDLPIAGSYTDSGNLRFPVEKTLPNVAQAAVFGQWASKNAREYFDNEYAPLKEKQIQEYIDSDLPIAAYRDYREGLKGKDTLGEKVAYIASLDLPISTKNMLVNNIADRKDPIDLANYGEYEDWGEFEYAHKYPEKYDFLQANNISAKQYESFDEDTKAAWSWAYQNPGKFKVAKAVASDVVTYREYTKALNDIEADKDSKGKSISGSRKNKVTEYINSLELDYGAKIILFKTEYTADDTYNREIVEYLNSREELSFEDIATILRELEFEVLSDGTVRW